MPCHIKTLTVTKKKKKKKPPPPPPTTTTTTTTTTTELHGVVVAFLFHIQKVRGSIL
jgi:hypothetical protein